MADGCRDGLRRLETKQNPACALIAAMVLAACTPALEPGDECLQPAPSKGDLAGIFNGNRQGLAAYSLVPVTGTATRKGDVGIVEFGGFTFTAKADKETGVLTARRTAMDGSGTATPNAFLNDGLAAASPGVAAYDVAFSADRDPGQVGQLVIGPATPDGLMATAGTARFSGPVVLTLTSFQETGTDKPGTVSATGTATLQVSYASKLGNLMITDLKRQGDGGALPFVTLEWLGLTVCGARIGSSGAGSFEFFDREDSPVNFAGGEDGSPASSAEFNSRFFGLSDTTRPQSFGGGFLVQGDSGVASAVFVLLPSE